MVYLESTEGERLSFYAPNVWMHQKRVLFPTFAILGSHLSNANQASEVMHLIEGGMLVVHPPAIRAWEELADAHQAMYENRHAGTLTVRVGATPALDAARCARQVFEAWGSRFVDTGSLRVRLDPVRPGVPSLHQADPGRRDGAQPRPVMRSPTAWSRAPPRRQRQNRPPRASWSS